jgi:hypothetical protein
MANAQYHNAFLNNVNDDLDKQARALNSTRKKMINNVSVDYDNDVSETCKGIECLSSQQNSKFLPHSFTPSFSFFSAQGDFSNGLPSHFVDANPLNANSELSDNQSIMSSDNISFGSQSDHASMFTTDTYNFSDASSLSPKIKKQLRLHTKHLQNQNNDDAILGHIRKCEGCKNELIALLQKEHSNHIFPSPIINTTQMMPNVRSDGLFNSPDTKDVLILIMIGVFIIILLDLFMRR